MVLNKYECAEHHVVAHQPGGYHQYGRYNAQSGPCKLAGPPGPMPQQVQQTKRQHRKQRSIGQRDHTPKKPEPDPRPAARRLVGEVQCKPQGPTQQKRTQAHLPHRPYGPVDGVREERPRPGRSTSYRNSVDRFSNSIEGEASECGKNAVECKYDPRGNVAVRPKQPEDSRQDVGIDRRCPGTGPGRQIRRRAETLSHRNRTGDTPHFPSELEVVSSGRDSVSMTDGNDSQAQQECDQNDEEYGMMPGSPLGRILLGCMFSELR